MIKIVSESLPRCCEGGNNVIIEDHLGALLLKTSKSSGVVSDRKQKSNWTCRAYIS